MYSRRQFNVFAATGLASLTVSTFGAKALTAPAGKPVLTIAGNISESNSPAGAAFDLKMIEALGVNGFETTCPWYDGAMKFEGPLMRKLLETVGAKGSVLSVQALNDYTTDIPMDDFSKFDAVLAVKRNGEYMPVRDKGPLFIVYPYDSIPELKSQTYYKRSAWQVARMTVK